MAISLRRASINIARRKNSDKETRMFLAALRISMRSRAVTRARSTRLRDSPTGNGLGPFLIFVLTSIGLQRRRKSNRENGDGLEHTVDQMRRAEAFLLRDFLLKGALQAAGDYCARISPNVAGILSLKKNGMEPKYRIRNRQVVGSTPTFGSTSSSAAFPTDFVFTWFVTSVCRWRLPFADGW